MNDNLFIGEICSECEIGRIKMFNISMRCDKCHKVFGYITCEEMKHINEINKILLSTKNKETKKTDIMVDKSETGVDNNSTIVIL